MQSEALYNYNDLMQQMLATNAEYLAISVGFLIFIGGFFFIINIKPFQTELSIAKNKIEELTKKNDDLLNKLESKSLEIDKQYTVLVEQFDKLDKETHEKISKEISELEKSISNSIAEQEKKVATILSDAQLKIQNLDWSISWNEHYTWMIDKVPMNVIRTLIEAIEKAKKLPNSKARVRMSLNSLREYLEENFEDIAKNESWGEVKIDLSKCLSETNDNEEIVEKIKVLIK